MSNSSGYIFLVSLSDYLCEPLKFLTSCTAQFYQRPTVSMTSVLWY